MAQVGLQEYCQELEGLVEHSAYDEAVAHCRHILEQYPKYVEAYRILGKAALDREDDKQASELFARVLSADPADFVSRAGLAIIYDRQGSLQDAVWQMERAYELEPGNPVVQEELRKLYARRDGVEPDKVPLTRGSLARLYLRGELYSEAVAELRALMSQEPDRIDLQVLLAEALWRDEQRLEAADMALKVLDRLPYCLDANLILGEIWMGGGRVEDAEVHLKRAQSLDPEAMRANLLFGNLTPVPTRHVEITKLDYAQPTAAAVEEEIPQWLTGISEQGEPGEGAEVPSWLQGMGAPLPGAPVAAPPPPVVEKAEPLAAAPPAEEVPAWLAGFDMGVTQPTAPTEAAPTVSTEGEAMPDWLSQLGAGAPGTEVSAEEGVPDWLAQLRAEAGPIPTAEAEVAPEAIEAPEQAEMPDWLQALKPQVEAAEVPAVEEEAAPEEAWTPVEPAEMPDWLQMLKPPLVEQPAPIEEPVVESEPAWLAQLRAEVGPGVKEEAAPEETLATPEPTEVPNWLQALQPQGVEAAPTAEVPEWLAALPTEAVEAESAEAAPAVPEETPAWLTGEGAMPSPEEALAYFQKLTAGKEAELQAQAEAEAEVRMADIMGRKSEAAPTPTPAPTPVTPSPVPVTPPPAPVVTPQPPVAEAPPPPVTAETPAWLTGEGAMPSPEEALAYFQKLTAGKEAELQAQAEAEAEVRMADIMGRKPEAAPAPAPVSVPPQPPAVEKVEPPVPEWLTAPVPAEAVEEPPVPVVPSEAELPEWLAVLAQPAAEAVPMEEAAFTVEPGVAEEVLAPSWQAPAEAVPPAATHVPIAPQAVGPEWWYQTLADEEGPTEEELAAEEAAEALAARVPVAEKVTPAIVPSPVTPEPEVAPARVAPPPSPKKLVRAKPAPAVPAQPVVDMEALMARVRVNPDDHQALRDMARGWVQRGDFNAARGAYDELVRHGALLDDVTYDLGIFVEDHPDEVEFIRLMGDAHMKAGNLQKALKLYRQALKKL
jgi:tetratricopeptide (TPR) repeat protein